MAAKKGVNDPPARTPEETPAARKQASRTEVVEKPTSRAQPVGPVLDALQAQAKDALSGTLFDDGTTTETTPLMKRMRSEIGSAEVSAKRTDPSLQARVNMEVRCDRDEDGDAGRYHVRAQGQVAREKQGGTVEAQIPVPIDVDESDGGLKLDTQEMREGIANAVRATDDARSEQE